MYCASYYGLECNLLIMNPEIVMNALFKRAITLFSTSILCSLFYACFSFTILITGKLERD